MPASFGSQRGVLHESFDAAAVGLLARGGGEDDVALQLDARIDDLADGGHHRSDAAFHVDGAASIDAAADLGRLEGRVGPWLFAGADHVGVADEQAAPAVAAGFDMGDDIRPLLVPAVDPAIHPVPAEFSFNDPGGRQFTPAGGRVGPDQVFQQVLHRTGIIHCSERPNQAPFAGPVTIRKSKAGGPGFLLRTKLEFPDNTGFKGIRPSTRSLNGTCIEWLGKTSECGKPIASRQGQAGALPTEVFSSRKIKFEASKSTLEAKKEEAQLTKIQCDRLDLELRSRDEEVSKLRASLNNSKSNKEYAAILTQLNTTRADNSKIETQILELMKAVEADDEECKKIRTQIEEQKQLLEEVRKKAETASVEHEAEIARIQTEWDAVAKNIPRERLTIFNRVADTYDGEAVVRVEQQDDRSEAYSCGGCFMGITAESVNLLMTRDEIIRCPNCTRILVLGELPE